jgi:hypothetical protein
MIEHTKTECLRRAITAWGNAKGAAGLYSLNPGDSFDVAVKTADRELEDAFAAFIVHREATLAALRWALPLLVATLPRQHNEAVREAYAKRFMEAYAVLKEEMPS